jgi:hypothetical protein
MRAYVRHHSPGRVRLRIPKAKRQPDALKKIAEAAEKIDGVRATSVNPITGSVLIRCAVGTLKSLGVLAAALTDSGLGIELVDMMVEDEGEIAEYSYLARDLGDVLLSADSAMKQATANQLDLRVLLPAAAGIAATVALSKPTMATPLWLTLAIFAFSSFVALNRLEDEPSLEGTTEKSSEGNYLH